MKAPFCLFDLKTGYPCPKCQDLIDKGEYTYTDFEVAKILYELEDEIPDLKKAEYVRSIEADGVLIVLVKNLMESNRTLLHRIEVRIAKRLSNRYRRVRLVVHRPDVKTVIGQILRPARIVSINIVWFPDGSSQYVVRIRSSDMRRLPFPREIIEKILSQIVNQPVSVAPA